MRRQHYILGCKREKCCAQKNLKTKTPGTRAERWVVTHVAIYIVGSKCRQVLLLTPSDCYYLAVCQWTCSGMMKRLSPDYYAWLTLTCFLITLCALSTERFCTDREKSKAGGVTFLSLQQTSGNCGLRSTYQYGFR